MTIMHIPAALTMTSREIAELVEARHNDVVATIERLFSKGLLRSSRKTRREDTGGRPIEVYDLIERDTHLVVSGYSDEHRARVIDRWQELEGQQHQPAELSRMDILKLAMESEQARIEAEKQLAMAAPKVEFVDRYTQASSRSKGFRQVCKLLGLKEPVYRQFLHDTGVMYRLGGEWAPYAQHIEAGRFEVKTGVAEHEDGSHAFSQAKFTARGVEWIAGEWAKAQVRGAA